MRSKDNFLDSSLLCTINQQLGVLSDRLSFEAKGIVETDPVSLDQGIATFELLD
jgi:hypothetical protein